MPTSLLDEYRDVARRLNERIEDLAFELLPAGYIENRRWFRVGSTAGEAGQSLAIELRGHKRGHWADYGGTEFGDALDLVQAVRGGDKRQAFDWAREWLRLPPPPGTTGERAMPSGSSRARPAARGEAAVDDYRRAIQRIWLGARELTPGDPVSTYLAERGIVLAELGRAPKALRYHPSLWNPATRRHWPAMVAAISSPDGAMVGVHRTWLEVDPFGATKAPIPDGHGPKGGAKRSLGGYMGGCIRLWRGASKKPWRAMPEGEAIVIGEGIEDCLSAVVIEPAWRTVCAVALGGMLALELPSQVKTVRILGQNDPRGSKAAKLLAAVCRHWREEGRVVRVARPHSVVKDWNEVLLWARRRGLNVVIDWGNDGGRGEQRRAPAETQHIAPGDAGRPDPRG